MFFSCVGIKQTFADIVYMQSLCHSGVPKLLCCWSAPNVDQNKSPIVGYEGMWFFMWLVVNHHWDKETWAVACLKINQIFHFSFS